VKRTLFTADHDAFRGLVRDFYRDVLVPRQEEWRQAGVPPRWFWLEAGKLGLLSVQVPAEYGGGGEDSFLFNVVLTEEAQAAGLALGGLRVHTDIVMPYFLHLASDEQRKRWLPALGSGEAVSALAMTEPGAGSDVRGITTRARRDGRDYVINGAKTFISNGGEADVVIVAAKTEPAAGQRERDCLTLFLVEREMTGFTRGGQLRKIGLHGQDLAELSFSDVRVPAANVLGEPGAGFSYLTRNLAQERLSISVNSVAAAAAALDATVAYVTGRTVFGQPVGSFQNTRFELAACATDLEAGQSLLDRALLAHEAGDLDAADAAKVKLFSTELQGRVIDRCLQLFGGYGYMEDYPIARAFVDARAARIYAGTSEIMKVIVARALGL
jgi:alkylation response protein AidB-like acyl-CoA dehydrogenase